MRALMVRLLNSIALLSLLLQVTAPGAHAAPGAIEAIRFESGAGQPALAMLKGPDARYQLVVTGRHVEGEVDVTRAVRYTTVPEGVVDVNAAGHVSPLKAGDVEVHALLEIDGSVLGAQTSLRVESFDDALPVNFPNQIVPIFTKFGCNGGGCHGKSGGQNGFRLSLLGFYPEDDHEFLVKESRGRRVFPASPERSLLLLKATNALPHGGGQRLEIESPEYRLLRRWMLQGMPYGDVSDPQVVRIESVPGMRVLELGSEQQLRVVAHYSDGSREDVTRMVHYEPVAKEILTVTEGGLVSVQDLPGAGAVMLRYQGHVEVFRATIPLGVEVTELPPARTFVDELVFERLKMLGIPPSGVCDDSTFLRRVTIDVAGRTPGATEVRDFLASSDSGKREAWIDRLLASADYADYFANKWSAILRNKNPTAAAKGSAAHGVYAFHGWIRDSLFRNKPYDRFVTEILTATGEVDENPPVVWYRSVKTTEEQVEDSAQLFLGQRLQCARCHHHPFERWSQKDYFSFAAFFSRVGRKARPHSGQYSLTVFHRPGDARKANPRTGEELAPAGLGGATLEVPPGRDPRLDLAAWQVDPQNPYFARSLVNRYWKHFFGRGLVEPEDDMRLTNPPSHPELLDALAQYFVKSGYDLKALVKLICQSTSYQLSSLPNDHNARDEQNFSRYYPQRLAAEVLSDAVDSLTGVVAKFDGMPKGLRAVSLPDVGVKSYFLTVFGRPSGDSSCECERQQEPNLAQSLHLMNSKQIQEKISTPEGRTSRLSGDESLSDDAKVEELTYWAFSRGPTETELEVARAHLAAKENNQTALEDIVWAFLNTKEFLFNH